MKDKPEWYDIVERIVRHLLYVADDVKEVERLMLIKDLALPLGVSLVENPTVRFLKHGQREVSLRFLVYNKIIFMRVRLCP